MPIFVADTFEPASGNNTFPVVADINVKNGYRVVADHASRNTIDTRLLTTGALVGVVDSDGSGNYAEYRFLGGSPATDADWVLVNTSDEIVWRPDGTGTAATWAEVMTQVTANRGPSIIVCDRPSASLTIPAGTYDLNGSGFFSNVGVNVFVSADDGVTLQNLTYVDGLTLTSNNSAADFLAYTTVEPAIRFSNFAELDNEGSVPWLAAYAGIFLLQLDNVADTASSWFIDLNSGSLTIKVLNAGPNGPGYTNGLVTGTGSVSLVHDGSGFNTALIVTSFPGLVGAYTNNPIILVGGAGPTSFRPSVATGNQGTTYYDTDRNQYLVWTGVEWVITEPPTILWKLDGTGDATTWADVVALVAEYPAAPPGVIVIDTIGNYPITDLGSPAELNYWSISFSNPASPSRKAIIASTAKINNLGGISGGGQLTNVALSGACLTWDNHNYRFFIRDHAQTNTIGSVAMVDASSATGSGIFNCEVDSFGHINNSLADAGVDGLLSIYMLEGASANNGFVGTAAAELVLGHTGSTATFSGATSPYGVFAGVVTNSPFTQMGGRGTTAHRPDSSVGLVSGVTYYDDDTSQYIVWDGATWKIITLT